jgi:ubiquitin-conjugating enzyme E2 J1
METDAKGQLGGLEMPESVRRRLAQESSSYKCAVCGRPNADIIKECEERAQDAEAPSQEVSVPAELNMGWKDELEAKKAQQQQQDEMHKQTSAATLSGDDIQSNAELAEGFVPTTTPRRQPAVVDASMTTANLAPPRRDPHPVQQQQPLRLAVQPAHHTNDGVPVWLDRAIVALVVLLAGLVLKILFGP